MTSRRLHWALKNKRGDYLTWMSCALFGVHLPITTIHYETSALFETRQQARHIAGKMPEGFEGYQPVRVRVDLVEVMQ
jgi:hypothetical protein